VSAAAVPFWAHPSAIVDEGAQIGAGTRVWHFAHVCAGARIGEGCSLGQGVFVGNDVVIGRNVKIQNQVSVYDAVTLEDDVFCGPSMVFTNVHNPRAAVVRKNEYRPTLVKRGATLGARTPSWARVRWCRATCRPTPWWWACPRAAWAG
jgi:UDP-2-acetamido-3-amino-2,3-dideoxy-glucuronate N-acetyltransferase